MDNNNQAAFMGALNSLKEYAKVNGNIVTKQDVESYFKDLGLDDSKYQMITGYLRYLSQMKIMKKMKNIYRCIWKI